MYRVRSRFLIFLWGCLVLACGDDSPSSPADPQNQRDVGVDSDAGPIPSNSVSEFDMGGREMDVDVSEVDSGVGMRADMSVENDGELPEQSMVRRDCETTFAYEGAATSVRLAGEWDWAAPESLSFDGERWVISKDLSGYGSEILCYKLIVDGVWILDPQNPYQAYCDGVQNSGVRVSNCQQPLLEVVDAVRVEAETFEAKIQYVAGRDASDEDAFSVQIEATITNGFESSPLDAVWEDGASTFLLSATGLSPGKYTVKVSAEDGAGQSSEPLLFPFWIEDEPFSWRDALIYMVMTDRYVNGDGTNDPQKSDDAVISADWEGGDLVGLANQIRSGYFDELGVRALWLSPVNTGTGGLYPASDGVHMVSGFHGYWPIEPRTVDPRLGGNDALKDVVKAAHERGMRILMDFVINHVHEEHTYFQAHPEWFNDGCVCGSPGCDWTEERLTCLFADYLPDVNWTNTTASEQFIEDALWWMENFDLDGARVDAVKHVDDLAIFNLVHRVNERFETAGTDYYLDGETAMGWAGDRLEDNAEQYGTINRYMGEYGLDGQFDFVLFHAVVNSVFAYGERGMLHLDAWTGFSQTEYTEGAIMTPYLGSHDTPRLASTCDYRDQDDEHPRSRVWAKWPEQSLPEQPDDNEPYDRATVALCWLLTIPGAPMVYMGDEYGDFGGGDPDNRHMFRQSESLNDRERQMLTRIKTIGQARQQYRPLRRGEYRSLGSTEEVLVFARETGLDDVVVAINLDETEQAIEVDMPASDVEYREVLSFGATISPGQTSNTQLNLPPRSCGVYVRN